MTSLCAVAARVAAQRPCSRCDRPVAFGYGGAMAEVVETHDLTTPSQDGWAVDYRIRPEDGEELDQRVGRIPLEDAAYRGVATRVDHRVNRKRTHRRW